MTPDFQRQTGQPLFPNILYNRPVTRAGAGRILMLGGHTGEFSQPTAINQFATLGGAAECRVLMPDKLAAGLGGLPGVYFGPSTQSGSLSRQALDRILELAEDSDAVAIGASLSNNSDTTMLLERVFAEVPGSFIIFADGLAGATSQLAKLANQTNNLWILTMAEVFKLCGALGIAIRIRPDGGLINKLEIISDLAGGLAGDIAVFGAEIIIASQNQLTVTPINYRLNLQPAIFYGTFASFWVQNRSNPLAGLTSAAYLIGQTGQAFDAAASPTVSQLANSLKQVLRSQEDNW